MLESGAMVVECAQRDKVLLVGEVPPSIQVGGRRLALPSQPNTLVREPGSGVCLWLRPDQRLLLLDAQGSSSSTVAELCRCTDSRFRALDAGARFFEFSVVGPAAADVLNAGCSLDLRPAAFPEGSCAQSRCDRVPCLLVRSSLDTFDVLVERPLAEYFRRWLRYAAATCRHPLIHKEATS